MFQTILRIACLLPGLFLNTAARAAGTDATHSLPGEGPGNVTGDVSDVMPRDALLLDATTFPTTFSSMDFTRSAYNQRKRWSFELLSTALGDVTNRHVQMGGLDAGVGFYVFDTVAIQMNLTGYGFSEGRSDGAAVGITLGIRHHIFNVFDNSVFLDVAGGEIEASDNIPYGGTHLNNTIQFGIGVAHPLAENVSLVAGVRYFHISNASSEGGDRNPSVNAIQGVLGFMWRF